MVSLSSYVQGFHVFLSKKTLKLIYAQYYDVISFKTMRRLPNRLTHQPYKCFQKSYALKPHNYCKNNKKYFTHKAYAIWLLISTTMISAHCPNIDSTRICTNRQMNMKPITLKPPAPWRTGMSMRGSLICFLEYNSLANFVPPPQEIPPQ